MFQPTTLLAWRGYNDNNAGLRLAGEGQSLGCDSMDKDTCGGRMTVINRIGDVSRGGCDLHGFASCRYVEVPKSGMTAKGWKCILLST